jgi:serine/threonine protein kinase
MKNTLPARFRFGDFELDLKSGELHKSGQKVVLQEQPLQILRMLAERAGEITTREEIQKQLWPNDTVVEFDHSINAAIKKLRAALGDSADNPKYIETVARRGYRLIVPVERIDSSAASESDGDSSSSSQDGTGIQVQLEPSAVSGKTVSHYRVLEIVGGGGMGVVYRAEDLRLGRAVALKFLPEEVSNDPRALERFEREARAASSLDHPNICSIYEFGEHEGQPFIVMQLLQGQSLRECLASGSLKKASTDAHAALGQVLDIAIQIAEGLEAAHEQGVVHRDIKPANVFITTKGVAKILDFGLAKVPGRSSEVRATAAAADDGLKLPLRVTAETETVNLARGTGVGTAAYMSPEQIRGQKLDSRTDLFSFGLILYEMTTGERTFTGEDVVALHEAILKRTPTPPVELNPEAPAELQQVIYRCLEKDRNLRYQHAAEIRSDLEKVRRRWEHPLLSRWKSLATVALVLMALVAGGLYWRSRKVISLTQKDTIVLAEVNNITGDAVFDDALNTALPIAFQQSPFFNLLSTDKVRRALRLMNHSENERLTQKTALEVCQRTGSRAVIAGSISDAGNHYRIVLNALNCQSGKSLANSELDAATRDQVVQALGIAAFDIRSKLGEPRASLKKFNKPLEDATSSSVDALQAFAESAKRKLNGGDVAANVTHLSRAVELDPNFAQAYVALGIAYLDVNPSLSVENSRKAYDLRDRVTERQRFFIEAMYYYTLGQSEKSIQTFSEWVKTYPGDFVAHNNLSSALLPVGQYEKAAAQTQESIRLRPAAFAYVNLMSAYISLGKL